MPRALWGVLIAIVPGFAEAYPEAELAERERDGAATFHAVLQAFTPCFGVEHANLSERQLRRFAEVVNEAVAVPDQLENAMATCFLEHLRQIRSLKTLAPYLSEQAKRMTRA